MGQCFSTTAQNCLFSSVLLGYACSMGGCPHCITKLQNRFAFPAPQSTYAITNGNELNFLEPMLAAELTATAQLPVDTSVRYLPSRSGSELAVFHFEPKAPPAAGKRRLTLLWSHGNAMDCGELHGFLSQLSLELDVGIVAYDYSGYGASTGLPSERNLLLDSQSVYDWIRSSLNVDVAHELVVYGQSVGSGPSVHLATKQAVRALVLHSPIASGIRVLAPNWTNCCSPVNTFACFDIFPNVKLAPKIPCPMLLIHGDNDEVVHWRNCDAIHKKARRSLVYTGEPHYVPGAGHNDVAETDPQGYLRVLKGFLGSLLNESDV